MISLYLLFCVFVFWKVWRKYQRNCASPPDFAGSLPLVGHVWRIAGYHAFDMIKSFSEEILQRGGSVLTLNAVTHNIYLPTWKPHRKYLNTIFRPSILKDFLVVFNYQGKRLVSQFEEKSGAGFFNHEGLVRLISLESVCMTSFAADCFDSDGRHKGMIEGAMEILNIVTERIQKFWLHSDFIYNRTKMKKKQDDLIKNINEITSLMLERRKNEIKENKRHSVKLAIANEVASRANYYNETISGEFTPFMTYLLKYAEESGSYTDEEILFETNTLVLAGIDTSACSITLILIMLGAHPKVQAKVYEELQNIISNSERDIDKDDLAKLVYLEAVIKETLRLYPVGPTVSRHIAKDIQLKNYTLKAGNGVAMLFWAMHRHPVWGPDAEEFRPERWLDGSLPNNPNAFGAFSLGRRSCIGKTYSMLFIKTVLAHVIRSCHIVSDISKFKLEVTTLLKPCSGDHIRVEKRKPVV